MSWNRSKLTVAAEIAAIAATVIAIVALAVVVFFDTGVRMPWHTTTDATPSIISERASTADPKQAEKPSDHSFDPSHGDDESQRTESIKARVGQDEFWDSWLGLTFIAFGSYLACIASSYIIGKIAEFFILVGTNGFFITIVTSFATSAIYLSSLWRDLSGVGVSAYLTGTVIFTIAWSVSLDDILD